MSQAMELFVPHWVSVKYLEKYKGRNGLLFSKRLSQRSKPCRVRHQMANSGIVFQTTESCPVWVRIMVKISRLWWGWVSVVNTCTSILEWFQIHPKMASSMSLKESGLINLELLERSKRKHSGLLHLLLRTLSPSRLLMKETLNLTF